MRKAKRAVLFAGPILAAGLYAGSAYACSGGGLSLSCSAVSPSIGFIIPIVPPASNPINIIIVRIDNAIDTILNILSRLRL